MQPIICPELLATADAVLSDTRTEAERRYDAERNGSLYFPTDPMIDCLDHIDRMDAELANRDPVCTFTETRGAVTVERWESPGSVMLDFTIGIGIPHRVLLGVTVEGFNPVPGAAEFVLDGAEVDNTWTLPKLRQLRDDLSDLLADERVLNAFAAQPPA